MDDYEWPYPYEICGSCMWRHGELLDMCAFCDEGDQYEEAELSDDDEPHLKRRMIRIKEVT